MKDWGSDMDESVAAMMLLLVTGGILMVAWAWSDLFAWALELSSTTRWVVFWGIVLGVAARILFWLKPWHDDAAEIDD